MKTAVQTIDSDARAQDVVAAVDAGAAALSDLERFDLLISRQSAILDRISDSDHLLSTLTHLVHLAEDTTPAQLSAIVQADDGVTRAEEQPSRNAPPIGGAFHTLVSQWTEANDVAPTAHQLRQFALPKTSEALACAERLGAIGPKVCWCAPIKDGDNQIIAILVAFFEDEAVPTPVDHRIFAALADMAKCAIQVERQHVALAAADERFSSLAKSVPGVIYRRVVRPDGDIRYTYISDAAHDLFGVSPEEIVADPQALFDCHGAEYYSTFRERLIAASQELQMWDVEATIITRTGERKFTHAIARPHRAADGSVVWDGVILDQTRIKEAELAAASAEARTRETIIESIPQGLVLYDKDDRLVTCNSLFLELYPFLKNQVEKGVSYESVVRAEIAQDPADDNDDDPEDRFREHMLQHEEGQFCVERRLPNGNWILVNERRTAEGSTVVLHTDVSDLKERETALERSNRELQDFAFVASHDLQEPLRKIEAFGGRLRTNASDHLDEKATMYLDRMLNAADRMRVLINDLLAYSRVTTKARPFTSVSLGRIVEEVVSDLQVSIEEHEADLQIGPLPDMDADPLQMRMLFQNVLSNAIKYRRPDVRPEITIQAYDQSGRPITCERPKDNSSFFTFTVTDNGIGFDMKYAERIFAIFQRLHGRNEYEGTGIGLATCRKIVERHGGSISAESTPGEGSKFHFTLPAKQALLETDT